MKIYLAGGEGLTKERQLDLFNNGCKNRLTSFMSGKSMDRTINAAKEWEKEQEKSE